MNNNNQQVWCIPTDCIPFLAAALSWDQVYINLGNKFLSDTTDKILTQIRDLIEFDEPSINQDLLIANVSEKIFYDYRSIKRNINQTYKQDINEVFNQYKYIISSRAASGDMPDQCVKEIICSMEQFKNRLLVRAEKMMKGNMIDEIIKLMKIRLKEKGIDLKRLDLVKDNFRQLMNNLLDNNEFNKFDADKKAVFVQANFQKIMLDKYDNDPNVQTIIDKTRLVTLPIIRNYIEKLNANNVSLKTNLNEEVQSYQIKQPERTNFLEFQSKLTPKVQSSHQRIKKINSIYDTNSSITKHIPDEFNQKLHHFRKEHDYNSQQISNTFIPFTDCTDYDPYRNYAQYKEKRLHNNKHKNVY